MFSLIFSTKNQKLVKKWRKEHKEIVLLAHKVISAYSMNNHDKTRKELIKLNKVAVEHMMYEDIELYKMLKSNKKTDKLNEDKIVEFKSSFKATKLTLMDFLTKYTRKDSIYDDSFFKTFNQLVSVLAERIDFEEKNLYVTLDAK